MTEEQEEALDTLRDAAGEVEALAQRLYSRWHGGDIPWDAAGEMQGEFCGDIHDYAASIKAAEYALRKSLVTDGAVVGGSALLPEPKSETDQGAVAGASALPHSKK